MFAMCSEAILKHHYRGAISGFVTYKSGQTWRVDRPYLPLNTIDICNNGGVAVER